MKPENSIKSVVFNDGFLYTLKFDDDGNLDYKTKKLFYFGYRTITQKRLDEAAQIQSKIDVCIHIPYVEGMIQEDDAVLIRGVYYRIIQMQHIITTSPPITVLTLCRWEMDVTPEGGDNV